MCASKTIKTQQHYFKPQVFVASSHKLLHWWCLGYSDCEINGKHCSLHKIDPSIFRAFIAIVPGMAILMSASKTIKTEQHLFKPQVFYEPVIYAFRLL